jgi:glycosyltransferase involved in cell wall biosynthesis
VHGFKKRMRDNSPLVSVIIAVRNGERFLAQAIESVLNSDYRPIEILIVDGQSEDKTEEIARSYPLVRYICQPNTGISEAYNLGIKATILALKGQRGSLLHLILMTMCGQTINYGYKLNI